MLAKKALPITPTIRAYCDDDWRAVCAIHDRARPCELKNSCDSRAFVPLADDQDSAEDFYQSQKFVACLGDTIIGFVGLNGTYISWLYVDPAYSRQGVGRQLLRLGICFIGLQTRTIVLAGNTPARRLYESEGFEVIDVFESTNAGYPCTCQELALAKE